MNTASKCEMNSGEFEQNTQVTRSGRKMKYGLLFVDTNIPSDDLKLKEINPNDNYCEAQKCNQDCSCRQNQNQRESEPKYASIFETIYQSFQIFCRRKSNRRYEQEPSPQLQKSATWKKQEQYQIIDCATLITDQAKHYNNSWTTTQVDNLAECFEHFFRGRRSCFYQPYLNYLKSSPAALQILSKLLDRTPCIPRQQREIQNIQGTSSYHNIKDLSRNNNPNCNSPTAAAAEFSRSSCNQIEPHMKATQSECRLRDNLRIKGRSYGLTPCEQYSSNPPSSSSSASNSPQPGDQPRITIGDELSPRIRKDNCIFAWNQFQLNMNNSSNLNIHNKNYVVEINKEQVSDQQIHLDKLKNKQEDIKYICNSFQNRLDDCSEEQEEVQFQKDNQIIKHEYSHNDNNLRILQAKRGGGVPVYTTESRRFYVVRPKQEFIETRRRRSFSENFARFIEDKEDQFSEETRTLIQPSAQIRNAKQSMNVKSSNAAIFHTPYLQQTRTQVKKTHILLPTEKKYCKEESFHPSLLSQAYTDQFLTNPISISLKQYKQLIIEQKQQFQQGLQQQQQQQQQQFKEINDEIIPIDKHKSHIKQSKSPNVQDTSIFQQRGSTPLKLFSFPTEMMFNGKANTTNASTTPARTTPFPTRISGDTIQHIRENKMSKQSSMHSFGTFAAASTEIKDNMYAQSNQDMLTVRMSLECDDSLKPDQRLQQPLPFRNRQPINANSISKRKRVTLTEKKKPPKSSQNYYNYKYTKTTLRKQPNTQFGYPISQVHHQFPLASQFGSQLTTDNPGKSFKFQCEKQSSDLFFIEDDIENIE